VTLSLVVVPVSLAPFPPFSVSQQTERGLIKIFALLVDPDSDPVEPCTVITGPVPDPYNYQKCKGISKKVQ
jgi:hypothetical protein